MQIKKRWLYLFAQVLNVSSRVELSLLGQLLQTYISGHGHRLGAHLQDAETSLDTVTRLVE